MKRERRKLSRHNEVAKAMDYMLKRIEVFTRFLDDGRICLSNNAAERGLRGIALGRKSWLFAGSDRGGERAAVSRSTAASGSMTPTTSRPSPSPLTGWNTCEGCSRSTNTSDHLRGLERTLTLHPRSASIMSLPSVGTGGR
jgi:hypothetical protein